MRILLFLITNMAVMLVIALVFKATGLERILYQNGMNMTGLLVMSALMGMTGSIISLFMSKGMAKRSMGVQVFERPSNPTEQWLFDTVARQSKQAGIGMPEVGIFNQPSPNAFATGMNKNAALVAVSTGLLEAMDQDEVEAVVGHEISHVANGDMVTLALIQGVVNTFVYFFANIIGRVIDGMISGRRNNGYAGPGPFSFMIQMVAQAFLSFLATLIVMWFSRWREYRADAGGAELAGRHKMIGALQALQRSHDPAPLPGEMAAFGINTGRMSKLFSSHPPLEARIAALEGQR